MRSFLEDYPNGSGRGALAPQVSDYVDARVLGAGANEVHAIPAGAAFVNFSADGDFYVKFGTSNAVTAAVPAADVTDGSAPILNPGSRRIPNGATHIALIAAAARVITMEWYGA